MSKNLNGRAILVAEIGLSVALAVVLGLMKVWQMPQGGEISLAMLPLLLVAFRRGVIPGMLAGALYGIVDAMLNPFIVHWVQYLLDYPLAYALVGVAGIVSHGLRSSRDSNGTSVPLIIVGSTVAAIGRYASHTLSGVIFFSEYAGPGQPVLLYSAGYNSSVLVSAIACGVAAAAIIPVLSRVVPVQKEVPAS